MPPPLTIGLTGGMGSGKTTVCTLFARLGIPIIDADEVGRQLTKYPNIRKKIVHALGRHILTRKGTLHRDKMRRAMLFSPKKRHRLEKILHPPIWNAIEQWIQQCHASYCIIAVPLLLETHNQRRFDRILIIDAPQLLRIQRVKRRNAWPLSDIQTMLDLQVSQRQRLQSADDIIINTGSMKRLITQVEQLNHQYQAFAQ